MPIKKVKTTQQKKNSNAQGKRVVKDYHKGTIAKGDHDVASKNVHKKYGTMGSGPKKGHHRVRVK